MVSHQDISVALLQLLHFSTVFRIEASEFLTLLLLVHVKPDLILVR